MAVGLDHTGFAGCLRQTAPHGGRAVGRRLQRVSVAEGQHHGVRLLGRGEDTTRPQLHVSRFCSATDPGTAASSSPRGTEKRYLRLGFLKERRIDGFTQRDGAEGAVCSVSVSLIPLVLLLLLTATGGKKNKQGRSTTRSKRADVPCELAIVTPCEAVCG